MVQRLTLSLRQRSERRSATVLGLATLLIALILIVVGIGVHASSATFAAISLSIGASLLASVMFSVLDGRTSRQEFVDMHRDLSEQVITIMTQTHADVRQELLTRELAAKADSSHRLVGLQAFFPSDKEEDCQSVMRQIIQTSSTLVLVMNYGRDWLTAHEDELRARFMDPTKRTEVFTPSPTSPIVGVQAQKQDCTEDAFRDKQLQTYRKLTEFSIGQPSKPFAMFGHSFFHPYFLVFGDTEVVMVPLYASQGKKVTVAMWFKATGSRDCMHARLTKDVNNLRDASSDLQSWFGAQLEAAKTGATGSIDRP